MASKIDCASYLFSGDGHILLGSRTSAGAPKGMRFIGNCTALEIALAANKVEKIERCSGARGVLATLNTEQTATVNITADSFSAENMAMVQRGTHNSVAAATGASVTGREIDALGRIVPLDHVLVSNVVVTIAGGGATLELDENYTVNAEHGSINILTDQSGAVLALDGSESIDIAYDYAAQDHVEALTTSGVDYWLRFEGLNRADNNQPVIVEVFKFQPDPVASLPLMHEEFGEFPIAGSALLDGLRTTGSQFFRWQYVSTAVAA